MTLRSLYIRCEVSYVRWSVTVQYIPVSFVRKTADFHLHYLRICILTVRLFEYWKVIKIMIWKFRWSDFLPCLDKKNIACKNHILTKAKASFSITSTHISFIYIYILSFIICRTKTNATIIHDSPNNNNLRLLALYIIRVTI